MRAAFAWLAMVVVGTIPLAGCLGGDGAARDAPAPSSTGVAAPGAAALEITDPAGDARVYNAEMVARVARKGCGLALQPPECRDLTDRLAEERAAAGVPAPPSLDIVAVRLGDAPSALVVEMDLAELDEQFTGVFSADQEEATTYSACWTEDDWDIAGECVSFQPTASATGITYDWVGYDEYSGHCNWWWWCSANVQFEVVLGAPATLRWTVPRDIMPNATVEQDLLEVEGFVNRLRPATVGVGYDLGGAAFGGANGVIAYRVDQTEYGTFTFASVEAPPAADGSAALWMEDDVGDMRQGVSGQLDILRLGFVETPTTVAIATKVAEVAETPIDHTFYAALGLPSGRVMDIGYDSVAGERAAYVGTPDDVEYRQYRSVPFSFDVVAGSPGWLNFTLLRADLEDLRAGDRTNLLYSVLQLDDRAPVLRHETYPVGPATLQTWQWNSGDGDWSDVMPVHTFRYDTEAPAAWDQRPGRVDDDLGDADLPQTVPNDDPAAYDITFLEIVPYSTDMSRMILGVQDASRLEAPALHAATYAVGIETAEGTFMVAYYRDQDVQQFFCAQDTLVLADLKQDPTTVVWQTIEGLISRSAESGGPGSGGGGSSGAITFFVPHTCAAAPDATRLEVLRMGGGSYLMVDAVDGAPPTDRDELRPYAVDDVTSDDPFTSTTARPPTLRDQFAAPFGIENFWDIGGIAGAVFVSLLGVLLVRNKRRVLQHYLDEIERITTALHEDPEARREALVQVAGRLKADLLRAKISEEHFVIVERRLEEHIGRKLGNGTANGDVNERLARMEKMIEGIAKPKPRPRRRTKS